MRRSARALADPAGNVARESTGAPRVGARSRPMSSSLGGAEVCRTDGLVKRLPRKKTIRATLTQLHQHDAAEDCVFQAFAAYRAQDYMGAEKAARKALRIEPGHQAATVLLSQLLVRSAREREVPGL